MACKEEYIEQEWFNIIYCFNCDYFNFQILALFNSSFSEISNVFFTSNSLACFKEVCNSSFYIIA